MRRALVLTVLTCATAAAQPGPPEASWGADRLAAVLKSGDTAAAVEAAKALAELTDSAVAFTALTAAVENGKLAPAARAAAIEALVRYGDARAAESFLRVLGEEEVRWAAADALLHFKSGAVTSRLITIVRGDKKAKRRATAAYSLGRFREPEGFAPLREALDDDKAEVRIRACAALAAYDDRRAVEPLIRNVETDKDRLARRAAVEALARVPDERSVRPLAAALHDKEAEVRAAAAESLAAIGDVRAI
ncbi:MAG: HEAT repeat domain-containing protein, partial [Candidatus Coatesbacteria bacterium]